MGKLCDRKGKSPSSLENILYLIYFFSMYLDSVSEENCTQSFVPMTPDQTSPLDLSIKRPFFHSQRSSSPVEPRTRPSHTITDTIYLEGILDPPEVLTQPKPEWHYRSLKDLQKKHLPYLAGIGPQRTPIRVTVSLSSSFQSIDRSTSVLSLGPFTIWRTNLSWNICCHS